MKRINIFKSILVCCVFISTGCSKDEPSDPGGNNPGDGFTTYLIREGQHNCDQNSLKFVNVSKMEILVKFDSSAIYQTANPQNQYDINKLWGFSEGLNHQYNSARIGWRWSDNALRIFGYVYEEGTRVSREISTVALDSANYCAIFIRDTLYEFKVNNNVITLPRAATGPSASGYQLYPYFGGDETAPKAISIKIKEM